ncbi:HupE/UreJ family protein [Herbiconiux moechotypicola]|uniref:HupE/UreJ family protein n=1 Tax=Herbiconiux moechotypicola TaxID=637393 RepID=A0ABP5QZV6_9MICO|nr:HupE/UreJ family protein [Herbiconiux moechotypicola]MCS5731573.1 HupE/UreJ family protein [Herbiconiux moechotypicola]
MTPTTHRGRLATIAAAALAAAAIAAVPLAAAAPAAAHGFTSTAYVSLDRPAGTADVVAELGLEYDLLVVSAADAAHDDSLFEDGMAVFETGDEVTALRAHPEPVIDYVTERFTVAAGGTACVPRQSGDFSVTERDGVPYVGLGLDYACSAGAEGAPVEFSSTLFADDEGYVTGTETIVDYDLDGHAASVALGQGDASFSTEQPWTERFAEFFLLGAEHLLGGLDHILFLLALIVGSRRVRDVVLAATTFTVAHSVTFLLAALGLVSVPSAVIEPIIALSIAVVALWYLWGVWRRPVSEMLPESARKGRLGLDRPDLVRLAVVFAFGLVHGLGFAEALGIDEPWSWTLLWSLLVFNVGIEAVQLGIIAVVFPVLILLRRRLPRVGFWAAAVVAAGVAIVGTYWFVERLLGVG